MMHSESALVFGMVRSPTRDARGANVIKWW